jgi:acetyl esterase
VSRRIGALDLGGTHVSAGVVDVEHRKVVEWMRTPLRPQADGDELLQSLTRIASDAAANVEGLGVAVPGPFDYAAGISWIEHKLVGLYGVDLRGPLAAELELDPDAIVFVNDADAFVLGEWWAGAARDTRRVVGVTLGTGLGSAFLADGAIVDTGPDVPPAGELHRLQFRGAPVESSVSSAALVERYGEPRLDAAEIAIRARRGDERAIAAFAELADAVGEICRPWLQRFAAACFVVGGSIAGSWELLSPALHMRLADVDGLERIVRASRIDESALLGGAHLASRQIVPIGQSLARRSSARATVPHGVRELAPARNARGVRPLRELSVREARAAQIAEPRIPAVDSYQLDTLELTGPVPIRLYRPRSGAAHPICVWFAGGGWVLDTVAAAEPACRRLAGETPCALAVVRYRLAPEHRFPIPLDDCLAATSWLVENASALDLDPDRLAIGGTSAGGNLAAAVTLRAREQGRLRFRLQVLVYPILLHQPADATGMADPAPDGFFGRPDVDWCWSHYLERPTDGESPLASPLREPDLSGLPRALVVTAGLDPLCEEGARYAARLREAGIPAELIRFAEVPHGFFSQAGVLDEAEQAQLAVVHALQEVFRSEL